MSWSDDLDALEAFRQRLPVPWSLEDLAAAGPGERVVAAAWGALRAAFVGAPAPRIDRRAQGLVELAAMVLGAVGGHGPRAIEELALANPNPGNDFLLVPLLLTITDHDGELFFEALRDGLESDDPARVVRALHLIRAGYGARFPFRITRAQADLLDAAVAVHAALGAEDPTLRGLLEDYVRPRAT